jgi:hypothetical protein
MNRWAREFFKILLFVGLFFGAWFAFDWPVALWIDGALVMFGLAIGDVLEV